MADPQARGKAAGRPGRGRAAGRTITLGSMVKGADPLESTPPALADEAARQILLKGFGRRIVALDEFR
jgi:xanthine dehydrogenase iron-sulfur cluster and FAD-binding subunit A